MDAGTPARWPSAVPGPPRSGGPSGAPDARSGWAVLRLLLVTAFVIAVAFVAGVGGTVILIVAFLLCILLHELGHFTTAKASGMKVTEFFVGFGPRVWSIKRGETEYGIKALPLGGYCRILGMTNLEDVEPGDEPRSYRQQGALKRLSVALAGSAVHFLLAVCLMFSMFFWTGDVSGYLPQPATIVGLSRLTTGQKPAIDAGFRLGDTITGVDGRPVRGAAQLVRIVQRHPGRRVEMTVLRDGNSLRLYPTLARLGHARVAGPKGGRLRRSRGSDTGFLGVDLDGVARPGLGAAISDTGGAWVKVGALTVHSLGKLVTFKGAHEYLDMLGSRRLADRPNQVRFVSPVGVVSLFHQAAGRGLGEALYLLAVLNISLGILNLIPFLPLDGGHVVIALYEGIRSRRGRRYHADVTKMLPVCYLAIAALAFIALTALFLDIRDLVA